MTLAEVKTLKVGDKFRRPSSNAHDADGWRYYTVVSIFDCITLVDHHGYHHRITTDPFTWKLTNKEWMKLAEKVNP